MIDQQTKRFYTTTFAIQSPESFDLLESNFDLYIYTIPPQVTALYRNKKTRNRVFAQTHNSIKEALGDYPYKSFTHAFINGKKQWIIFTLLPSETTVPEIQLDNIRYPITAIRYSFGSVWNDHWFNIVKLLQIAYARNSVHDYFIGRDVVYVYAQEDKRTSTGQICVQIDLSGWNNHIRVLARAKRMFPEENPRATETYFQTLTGTNNEIYFVQIKPSDVKNISKTRSIYKLGTIRGKRTSLPYFDTQNIPGSRVDILQKYIMGFTEYLDELGFITSLNQRAFRAYAVSDDIPTLNISKLKTIYVLDKRHSKKEPFSAYMTVLESALADAAKKHGFEGQITFKPINMVDSYLSKPILVIQDADFKAYSEDGILYGNLQHEDPYPELYQQYPHVSFQFFNINPNDATKSISVENYLSYPFPKLSNEFRQKILVSCLQLYLKQIVLHPEKIAELPLPYAPVDYIYLYKKNRKTPPVMLFFDNKIPNFRTIDEEKDRQFLAKKAGEMGVNWEVNYGQLLDKYKPDRDPDETELNQYHIILGNDLFVEIEDLNERVLYNTEALKKRYNKRRKALPIEHFLLEQHYDQIKAKNLLTINNLQKSGLLNGDKQPSTDKERKSLEFFRLLQAFDERLLDANIYKISFEKLSDGTLGLELAKLLNCIKKDKEGQLIVNRTTFNKRLTDFYNHRNREQPLFPSPKDSAFHLFSGIWYTDDYIFTVGNPGSLKTKQPRAHLIRQVNILQGQNKFDFDEFLSHLAIDFVRLEQYTVLPYWFNLLSHFLAH